MIEEFGNYLRLGKVKKKISDKKEAKALLEKASQRLDYIKSKEISEKTAQFVLEDSYEAIREAAQSLMSIKGFKPYSHEATISFLKEFYPYDFDERSIQKLDMFRQLRNDSIYKAVQVLAEDAADILMFAEEFIVKVSKLA